MTIPIHHNIPSRPTHHFEVGQKVDYNGQVWSVVKIKDAFLYLSCDAVKNQRMGLLRAWQQMEKGYLKIVP